MALLGQAIFTVITMVAAYLADPILILQISIITWISGAALAHFLITRAEGPPPSELKAILLLLLRWPEVYVINKLHRMKFKKPVLIIDLPEEDKFAIAISPLTEKSVLARLWEDKNNSERVRVAAFANVFHSGHFPGFDIAAVQPVKINGELDAILVAKLDGSVDSYIKTVGEDVDCCSEEFDIKNWDGLEEYEKATDSEKS